MQQLPNPSAAAHSDVPGLSEYSSILRKRRGLLLKVALPIAAIGAAFAIGLPDIYSSTGHIEIEGAAQLPRGMHAGGYAAWLDATYDRYIAVGVGGVSGDVAGRRLNNAPGWSGRVWLEWNGRISKAAVASVRADGRWQSTVFFTPFNDTIQRQRPYGLLDVSAEFAPTSRRWSIGAYTRNLTNEDYITGSFSSPPPAIGGRPGEPRELGFQLILRR